MPTTDPYCYQTRRQCGELFRAALRSSKKVCQHRLYAAIGDFLDGCPRLLKVTVRAFDHIDALAKSLEAMYAGFEDAISPLFFCGNDIGLINAWS
jgi:hypothetical protein